MRATRRVSGVLQEEVRFKSGIGSLRKRKSCDLRELQGKYHLQGRLSFHLEPESKGTVKEGYEELGHFANDGL